MRCGPAERGSVANMYVRTYIRTYSMNLLASLPVEACNVCCLATLFISMHVCVCGVVDCGLNFLWLSVFCCPVARQLLINVVTVKLEKEQVQQRSLNVESMLMVRRGGEGRGGV